MAKKKINIKSVTSDVPSGDVNITYKNVRIAGLSESTTAVLETEDTICEDDIEVEYTKPTPETVSITVNKPEIMTVELGANSGAYGDIIPVTASNFESTDPMAYNVTIVNANTTSVIYSLGVHYIGGSEITPIDFAIPNASTAIALNITTIGRD